MLSLPIYSARNRISQKFKGENFCWAFASVWLRVLGEEMIYPASEMVRV